MYFSTKLLVVVVCTIFLSGNFGAFGKSNSKHCPVGQYTSKIFEKYRYRRKTRTRAVNVCLPCPVGTFMQYVGMPCTSCPSGTNTTREGQTSCIPTGGLQVTTSKPGYFLNHGVVWPCPEETFSGTSGAQRCTVCPLGTTSKAGQQRCTKWVSGNQALTSNRLGEGICGIVQGHIECQSMRGKRGKKTFDAMMGEFGKSALYHVGTQMCGVTTENVCECIRIKILQTAIPAPAGFSSRTLTEISTDQGRVIKNCTRSFDFGHIDSIGSLHLTGRMGDTWNRIIKPVKGGKIVDCYRDRSSGTNSVTFHNLYCTTDRGLVINVKYKFTHKHSANIKYQITKQPMVISNPEYYVRQFEVGYSDRYYLYASGSIYGERMDYWHPRDKQSKFVQFSIAHYPSKDCRYGIEMICAKTNTSSVECRAFSGSSLSRSCLGPGVRASCKRIYDGVLFPHLPGFMVSGKTIGKKDEFCNLDVGVLKCGKIVIKRKHIVIKRKHNTQYSITIGLMKTVFIQSCKSGMGVSQNGLVCKRCKGNTFSSEDDKYCRPCAIGLKPSKDRGSCENPYVKSLTSQLANMKEDQNDLSIKNSRLWAKEQVRMKHDDWMAKRKERDNKKERDFCKDEEAEGTVVFPAIDVPNEIEKIEDTTCIDTNRDELLKAFCSFTTDLDSLFTIQNIKKKAASFFPNICCKERRDEKLEACEDPSGTILRENIIPFALSQGGHYSRHNLYAEVTDALKKNGYLHQGMTDVLKAMGTNKEVKQILQQRIDGFFKELSLCGPRLVDEPGTEGEKQLCQLFVPYGHVLKHFYNELAGLYQSNSFLEVNEYRLGKVSAAMAERQGKVGTASHITRQLSQSMQMKKMNMPEQQCIAGLTLGETELAKKKQFYCKGINHVDLMTPTIKNVALYYLKKEVPKNWTDKQMFGVKDSLRYEVKDKSGCPSKLFDADDISIQQVAMNADGTIKDWAAVIKLNTDEGGYLKSEMPKCESAKYMPRAEVTVKVFEDKNGIECCQGSKDKDKCDKTCTLPPFMNPKEVTVTGTVYDIKDSVTHRRKLLQRGGYGNCRL